MARSRDISKVLSSNTTLATDAEVAATYQTKATTGLTLLTPASIANTGGTASIGANGTVSFTSASAISLNDVFSTTHDAYRIVIRAQSTTSAVMLRARLRFSGADATGSDYYGNIVYMSFGSTTISPIAINGGNYFRLIEVESTSNVFSSTTLDLINPFLTQRTFALFGGYGDAIGMQGWQQHAGGSSYTGITIYPSANALNGSISVYGYNK
jgi:hypothetical protein